MIKLAILGIENGHSWQFSSVLANKEGKNLFDDVELIGVYGDYSADDGKNGMAQIKRASSCERFAKHYNEFVDEADAVMVTARYGGNHFKYAEEYIKKGIPVWVDKPITCSSEEVVKMIELANKHNCILTGGSGIPYLKNVKEFTNKISGLQEKIAGGHVTAPANLNNNYGGFWFYTQHLAQMITCTFGNDVRSVRAFEDTRGVNAIYYYDDFTVSAYFGTNYSITVYDEKMGIYTEAFELPSDYYMPELLEFYNLLKTKKPNMTYRDIATPVYMIEATIKAYSENKEVEIDVPF